MAVRSADCTDASRPDPGGVGARLRAAEAAVRIVPSPPADGAGSDGWAAVCALWAAARARKVAARTAGWRNLVVCAAGLAVTPGCELALSFWAAAGRPARTRTRMAPTIRMGTPARPSHPRRKSSRSARLRQCGRAHGIASICKAAALADDDRR